MRGLLVAELSTQPGVFANARYAGPGRSRVESASSQDSASDFEDSGGDEDTVSAFRCAALLGSSA